VNPHIKIHGWLKKMARTRLKAKGRRESGAFAPIPCSVLNHANFKRLSGNAMRLLMELVSQIRFKEGGTINNGDLTIAWLILKERGWKSKETIQNAILELLHYGFVVLTRQGGRNLASLYAVTWWAIDECKGKLDVSETRVAPNDWKTEKEPWQRPERKNKSLPRFSDSTALASGAIVSIQRGKM
jgi:hypothetical protein